MQSLKEKLHECVHVSSGQRQKNLELFYLKALLNFENLPPEVLVTAEDGKVYAERTALCNYLFQQDPERNLLPRDHESELGFFAKVAQFKANITELSPDGKFNIRPIENSRRAIQKKIAEVEKAPPPRTELAPPDAHRIRHL